MGFKTDYKEITLKDLCNLNCFNKSMIIILYDYNAPINENPCLLNEAVLLDDIPEIYSDWYVEYISAWSGNSSEKIYPEYILTIREP